MTEPKSTEDIISGSKDAPEVKVKFGDLSSEAQKYLTHNMHNEANLCYTTPWRHYPICSLSRFYNFYHFKFAVDYRYVDYSEEQILKEAQEKCDCDVYIDACLQNSGGKSDVESPPDKTISFSRNGSMQSLSIFQKVIENELFTEWNLIPTVYPVITKIFKYRDEFLESEEEPFLVLSLEERMLDQLIPRDKQEAGFAESIGEFINKGGAFHVSYDCQVSKKLVSCLCFSYAPKPKRLPSLNEIVHECTHSAIKVFQGIGHAIEVGQDEPFCYYLDYLVANVSSIIL